MGMDFVLLAKVWVGVPVLYCEYQPVGHLFLSGTSGPEVSVDVVREIVLRKYGPE
jgi:hypothetical protein